MKIRNGFVSNSSSSSFVVIANCAVESLIEKHRAAYGNRVTLEVTADMGNHQFGWENETYHGVWDKAWFSFIQADYVKDVHPEWMEMLNDVLKEELNVELVKWNLSTEYDSGGYCYIDHQSASTEGSNIGMFESKNELRNFIFNDSSYIEGGNDNN